MEEQKRNPAAGLSESEQVQVRRQKLADLQAAGNDPFTLTKFPQDAYSADLKEEFKELPNETDSGKLVALVPFYGQAAFAAERSFMEFFNSAIGVLQTLVIALGAGLGIWGVINLLEGYGNDNPGANAHVR